MFKNDGVLIRHYTRILHKQNKIFGRISIENVIRGQCNFIGIFINPNRFSNNKIEW